MAVQGALKDKAGIRISEPKKYNVVMYNDDFTTMEFVVKILVEVFHKNDAQAEALMLKVHNVGKAVVGSYPYDIASTRVSVALLRAKEEGFPFKVAVEEA